MPKHHTVFPAEFRRQIVELFRAGRSARGLAREFEPSDQTIRDWITQAELDSGQRRNGGLTSAATEEPRRLTRENWQLKLEREILSKAAGWFAREDTHDPQRVYGFVRDP